jgi:hypothetical protein
MVVKLGRIGCPEIRVGFGVMPYGNGREVEVRGPCKEAGGAGVSHTKLWVPPLCVVQDPAELQCPAARRHETAVRLLGARRLRLGLPQGIKSPVGERSRAGA